MTITFCFFVYTLTGRSLVFSNKTGVSLHGEVVLSSGDVTTDWMTVCGILPYFSISCSLESEVHLIDNDICQLVKLLGKIWFFNLQ